MKILVDENVPKMTVLELKHRGHDVLDLRGTSKEGLLDSEVWEIARKESRLLITTDKGLGQHRQSEHPVVLMIRLRQPNRRRIHKRIIQAIDRFPEADWAGKIVVMRDKTLIIIG